ncbi:hypothetical protein FOB72_20620 [Cupriavidus pauculus]|uniref:Lipoprotein n=1 Tax=Cupriavidus pauculus TaxID=82633 RepID=A0A5P2H9V7_9BURK|nr:hypothetical protein [Cupriavidus pauculus]QET04518.1 hypothetical protein FOB72_20620 [Cupriavidus pauculus]
MKRTLATTALAVSALFCLPALAQQQPPSRTSPMPSNPPVEGPGANRGTNAGIPGNQNDSTNMTMQQQQRDTQGKSKNTGDRAKKPRQQDAPAYSTADAPSGPKGDSPDPAPKNK